LTQPQKPAGTHHWLDAFLSFSQALAALDGMIGSPGQNDLSYLFAAIPVARDSNNSLAQGTSYIFGLTRSFQMLNPS
jgi:hypothetical protein